MHHEAPDGERGDGHDDVFRRGDAHDGVLRAAPHFEAARDAGELADHVAEVGEHEGEHEEERGPQSEFLPDQIAQALARDCAHARRHLLHDHERNGDRDHRPQQRVAELGARH